MRSRIKFLVNTDSEILTKSENDLVKYINDQIDNNDYQFNSFSLPDGKSNLFRTSVVTVDTDGDMFNVIGRNEHLDYANNNVIPSSGFINPLITNKPSINAPPKSIGATAVVNAIDANYNVIQPMINRVHKLVEAPIPFNTIAVAFTEAINLGVRFSGFKRTKIRSSFLAKHAKKYKIFDESLDFSLNSMNKNIGLVMNMSDSQFKTDLVFNRSHCIDSGSSNGLNDPRKNKTYSFQRRLNHDSTQYENFLRFSDISDYSNMFYPMYVESNHIIVCQYPKEKSVEYMDTKIFDAGQLTREDILQDNVFTSTSPMSIVITPALVITKTEAFYRNSAGLRGPAAMTMQSISNHIKNGDIAVGFERHAMYNGNLYEFNTAHNYINSYFDKSDSSINSKMENMVNSFADILDF